MATVKDWLNQKFSEWEKAQGRSQSYYAFARYLEVSQSGLSQWMIGNGAPGGDDLTNIGKKLGVEIYDVMGLPRPNANPQVQRFTASFANLPAEIRDKLTNAVMEADNTMRQQRMRPDSAEARRLVIDVLAKWGFRYGS